MSDRATLTLLPNGQVVLGSHDITPEELPDIARLIREWLAQPDKTLLLSFPVDVIDLRGGTPASPLVTGGGGTVSCTCPKYPPNYVGDALLDPNCPVHRYAWTYTTTMSNGTGGSPNAR